MFELFESYNPHIIQSHRLFPEWDYVKRNMIDNLAIALKWYHERPSSLNRSNPIINILVNIGFNLNVPLDQYMRIAEERIFYLTLVENLTSTSSYGSLLPGKFYGRGSKELVIVDTNDFDYRKHLTTWKEVSPLEVILSDISDLSLLIPDGNPNWELTGNLNIFSLNLKKLLFVYYMWNKQNLDYINSGEDKLILSTHHLMKMIIMPNILISQVNMIVLNRLMNIYYGKPMSKNIKRTPFTLKDLTRRMDSSLENMLDVLNNTTYTYETLLSSIPAITSPDMYKFLQMPDLPPTRQINWSYAVARSSIFKFIIELGGIEDIKMNKRLLVDARININYLMTEHLLKYRLTSGIYEEVQDNLDYIYNAIDSV
jgi:hypothetical protein